MYSGPRSFRKISEIMLVLVSEFTMLLKNLGELTGFIRNLTRTLHIFFGN